MIFGLSSKEQDVSEFKNAQSMLSHWEIKPVPFISAVLMGVFSPHAVLVYCVLRLSTVLLLFLYSSVRNQVCNCRCYFAVQRLGQRGSVSWGRATGTIAL